MMSDDFFKVVRLIVIAHSFPLEEVLGENFVAAKELPVEPTGPKNGDGKTNGDGTGGQG